MPRDDSAYLLDMLLAARDALSFTEGMPYEEFAEDRRTQLSVLKSVEIVGEAAARVSEDTKRAHPALPWREIVGIRNRLVHAYFDIDLPLVWDTVRDDLPGSNWPIGAARPTGGRIVPRATIDRLIVNSPYEEPAQHWRYDRTTRLFDLANGRRPAGYVVASGESGAFDDPGVFREIPLVNRIRERVKAWCAAGYPGVTGITKRLLEHWHDPEEFESRRFFFCQLEAVETLIWLTEAPSAERVGIDIPSDGGAFARLCAKMATGSGKTVVMAMVIAWHVLNKVTNPRDARFAKNVLVVAPGLRVRSRLAVLGPSHVENYYEAFRVVPPALLDKLRRSKVVIRNWHALNWETDERVARKRSVDKRGAKSDEAYVRDVLGEMASARNVLVVNDEAHHAWRVPAGAKIRGVARGTVQEATKWVGGLDRIHRARGILACYDFSATPFVPSGRRISEEALFGWIVNDFGLNDAIESGLGGCPRIRY